MVPKENRQNGTQANDGAKELSGFVITATSDAELLKGCLCRQSK
jgi:hypothetical protein